LDSPRCACCLTVPVAQPRWAATASSEKSARVAQHEHLALTPRQRAQRVREADPSERERIRIDARGERITAQPALLTSPDLQRLVRRHSGDPRLGVRLDGRPSEIGARQGLLRHILRLGPTSEDAERDAVGDRREGRERLIERARRVGHLLFNPSAPRKVDTPE